jgi:hypothetical protein
VQGVGRERGVQGEGYNGQAGAGAYGARQGLGVGGRVRRRAWAGRTCGLRVLMLERLPSGSIPIAWR